MKWRECTQQDEQAVLEGLRAYNQPYIGTSTDLSQCVEEDGRVVAGILARLLGDCIYVEILWVDESLRHRGVGRELLARVEEAGRARGAKRIELDTFSFQAPEYYPKLGFREFGRVEPYAGTHGRYYFIKELD